VKKSNQKIAILGSRGIPNRYGGFEQCAEFLSAAFYDAGHDVTVFNTSNHEFKEKCFNQINIERVFCPERMIGSAAHIIYDFLCLMHCIFKRQDIIIMLGYSSSVFGLIASRPFLKNSKIVVNMDGLEWQRTKWSIPVRWFTKWAEKRVILMGLTYVSDNRGLVTYFKTNYQVATHYIPYGTVSIGDHETKQTITSPYNAIENYAIIVARIEPENNVEMVLEAILDSNFDGITIIVGSVFGNKYAEKITKKFAGDKFLFVGGIYDPKLLNQLRYRASIYFHGHSVGGTNPSLVEAMQLGCRIFSYDNIFNRETTQNNAVFFKTSEDLSAKINSQIDNNYADLEKNKRNYPGIIQSDFDWNIIAKKYLELCKN
jgi:glycosyltransferase involved in cell wall biosynthesis